MVYQRPNGKWAVQVWDTGRNRYRQVGTAESERAALRLEAEALTLRAASGRERVGSFHARWLTDYPRPAASTTMTHQERTKAFLADFGNRWMDTITADEARRFCIAHRNDLPSLRAMFEDARRSNVLQINPFSKLGLERSRGRRDLPSEWLTAEDVLDLAECARSRCGLGDYGPIMAAQILFAAYTGLRPGERYVLELGDLRGQSVLITKTACSRSRTVRPLPKNGRWREVVYPRVAREAVEGLERLGGQTLVFPGPRGGQLWASSFSWIWGKVKVKWGRPDMDFYELRHFCATHLLELGLAPADVAVQLGHTDGGALVMSTYGHPSERRARLRIAHALDGEEREAQPIGGASNVVGF